jgi:hypothetical protein
VTAPLHDPKECRSCGRSIFWAQNDATGRSMPVDAEPCDRGNVQLVDRGGSVVAKVLGPEEARRVRDATWALTGKHVLRVSHFVTCAQAASWRTKRKAEARDG